MWILRGEQPFLLWQGVWYPWRLNPAILGLRWHQEGYFESNLPFNTKLRQLFVEWMVLQAKEWLPSRAQLWQVRMGVTFNRVRISNALSSWGYCTQQGVIYLNWRIMAAPVWVQDYVVVHELAHLRFFNHSVNFWNLVKQWVPETTRAILWLRVFGQVLFQSCYRVYSWSYWYEKMRCVRGAKQILSVFNGVNVLKPSQLVLEMGALP